MVFLSSCVFSPQTSSEQNYEIETQILQTEILQICPKKGFLYFAVSMGQTLSRSTNTTRAAPPLTGLRETDLNYTEFVKYQAASCNSLGTCLSLDTLVTFKYICRQNKQNIKCLAFFIRT